MPIEIRRALAADLPAIVAMLADDTLGRGREDPSLPLAPGYLAAYEAISADPNQQLVVAVEAGRAVGTLHLLITPGLSKKGAWRGTIQAVRVVSDRRGSGIGAQLVGWAVQACRARGCAGVQLSTHASRIDAHRFYERLGFRATHLGFTRTA